MHVLGMKRTGLLVALVMGLALAVGVGSPPCFGGPPDRAIDQVQAELRQSCAHLGTAMTLLDRPPRVKLVPWFDLGAPTTENITNLIYTLRSWEPLTDRAIVTIGALSFANIFQGLQEAVPGVEITPAITTSSIFGHSEKWEDEQAWAILIERIEILRAIFPDRAILLENEYALRDYCAGRKSIDLELFGDRLASLPEEVEYIWYPSAGGSGEKLARYLAVDGWVAFRLRGRVTFADHVSLYSAGDSVRPDTLAAAKALRGIGAPTVPVCYPFNWTTESLPAAVELVARGWGEPVLLVYPGRAYWSDSAAQWSAVMNLGVKYAPDKNE